jgi:hypothetical protein
VDLDWPTVERELGVNLPSDYKQVCEAFGPGEFSDYLDILCANTPGLNLLHHWHGAIEAAADRDPIDQPHPYYAPYQIFERNRPGGLIPWAITQTECEFYWLADSGNPDAWPIIARYVDSDWNRFDMSTSEFIVRILTDIEFRPYSVAGIFPEPYFDPLEAN